MAGAGVLPAAATGAVAVLLDVGALAVLAAAGASASRQPEETC